MGLLQKNPLLLKGPIVIGKGNLGNSSGSASGAAGSGGGSPALGPRGFNFLLLLSRG